MSTQIPESSVAHFIKKTYQILQNKEYQQAIHWLSSGKEFAIKDISIFEQDILPTYFRHRNIHSFVRQLNMYGFHKSRKDPSKNIFSNQFFKRGREDLLPQVRRKCKVQERNSENIPPVESQLKVSTPKIMEQSQNPAQNERKNDQLPEFIQRQSDDKSMILPHESKKRCSLNLLICPSGVMSQNPDVYSNLRVQAEAFESSDSENISIEDQIQKDRKINKALRSGVSLVQTRNLLKTHNHIQN